MNRTALVVGVTTLVCSVPLSANPIEQFEKASSYSQQGKWQDAAAIYDTLIDENPYHGAAWQRYGFALHQLGRYDLAIEAFEQSIELGFRPTDSKYNIACGYALLGNKDAALEWLARAMDEGFVGRNDLLRTDTDLDSIRDNPRFREITGLYPPQDLSRDDRWRYDLDYLARRMEQIHYDLYDVMTRGRFERAIRDLKAAVPELEDYQVAVGVQRILAMVGDGHTFMLPPIQEMGIHRYPINVYRYSDGLFVQAATPAYASVVGGRIVSIGGTTVDKAWDAVAEICSHDNASGLMFAVQRYLVIPEILHAVGVVDSIQTVPLTVETRDGGVVTIDLEPIAFNELGNEFVRARDGADAPLPLWLKDQNSAHWFEFIEADKLVYAQYNQVRDMPGESVEQFSHKLFEFIDENPVEYLVIDMRNNGGGNNFLNKPLVHGLIGSHKVNRRGHLFVITGRRTFSAAMNGAADIEANTEAIFVGEPTGSKPNFVGETTIFPLPCSGLQVSISSLYWQRSHAFDYRIWIAPDLLAELSSEDYRTNRDPSMEAIHAFIQETTRR